MLKNVGYWVVWLAVVTTTGLFSRASERFDSAYLSEILAINQRGLKDEDGQRWGWIEIHNGGKTPVTLRNWFLTDSPTNVNLWRFPGVVILPDKQIVVFLSGKNRTNDLARLHAGFRPHEDGGYVALLDASTNVISTIRYPAAAADVSFGSARGEPATRGPMEQPTPARPNLTSGKGLAPGIVFSVPTRTFIESISVALTCSSPKAVIRYTLDGSLPGSNSPTYSAPLVFSNTVQVRARAYETGLLPGPPRSEAYLKLFSDAVGFTSTLPMLVIDTLGKETPVSTHSSFAQFCWFEPVNGRSSLTNLPSLSTRGGYRTRGSSSAGMPQPSYAIDFLDEFDQDQDLSPLGLPADSDWILYAPNSFEPVLIHNPFVHQISRDMGRYSPRTRFVEVFMVRSAGRVRAAYYSGLYVLEEKIKVGKNRLNIGRLGLEDLKPPQVTGGYVLKFDRLGPGESGLSVGFPEMAFVEPREQVITLPQRAPQKNYIAGFLKDFHEALDGPSWKDPAKGYRAYLDVPAAIDFHVLEVLSGNVDSMVLSTYFHKPRNGKIVCGPHWDFDRALGSTDGRDENPRNWNTGPFFAGTWWPKLFSDPDFWQLWVDRWQELRQSEFSLKHLDEVIDRLSAEIKEAQPREYQKWGFQPRGGSYQAEVNHLKQWLSNRIDYIDGQLVQPPKVVFQRSQTDLTLSFSAPTNVAVYYTRDGSDPRLPQGGISTNALVASGPIAINPNTPLFARAFNPRQKQTDGPPTSTAWSGVLRTNLNIIKTRP